LIPATAETAFDRPVEAVEEHARRNLIADANRSMEFERGFGMAWTWAALDGAGRGRWAMMRIVPPDPQFGAEPGRRKLPTLSIEGR
jgi:hypothetical protein